MLLTIGGIFLYCSTWDYETLKELINSNAADGEVETYTETFHEYLTSRAMVFGIALLLLAVTFITFIKKVERTVSQIEIDAKQFWQGWNQFRNRTWKGGSSFQNWMFVGVLILGAIFRGLLLNEPVIYDEAFTYNYYAQKPLYVIFSDYSYPNNQIFHTLLVKWSTSVFGVNHFGLRLPVFIAGIATLYFSYFIAFRFLKSRNAALVVLSVLAFSGVLIEYSAIARGYSMVLLFTLLAVGAADHYITSGNRFSLIFVAGILALAFFTIPIVLYPALTIFAWMFFQKWRDRKKMPIEIIVAGVGSAILVLILYTPVIITYGFTQLVYQPQLGYGLVGPLGCIRPPAFDFDQLFSYYIPSFGIWLSAVFMVLIYFGFFSNRKILYLLLSTLVVVPVVLIQGALAPPRVWTFLLVFISFAIGAGFMDLFEKWKNRPSMLTSIVMVCIVSIGIGNVWMMPSARSKDSRHHRYYNTDKAVDYVAKKIQKGTRVVVAFPQEAPTEFYFRAKGIPIEAIYRKPEETTQYIILYNKLLDQRPEDVWRDRELPPEIIRNADAYITPECDPVYIMILNQLSDY